MDIEEIAHEIWAAAQLLPYEGIEEGVSRIEEILNEKFIIQDEQLNEE